MPEISKRLEIIKSSLAIEEMEIIELQSIRLKQLPIDEHVEKIITCIDNGEFGILSQMIEEYLASYTGIIPYEDQALQGLRIELKNLERNIQALSETRAEYLRMLHEFSGEYNKRLGELIKRLLQLREEYLAKASEKDSAHRYAYQEAKADSASFDKEYEENIKAPPLELTKEDREEIKKFYRQASRLCHPDTVEDSKKQQAEEIFKALGSAYEKGDKEAVKKILEALESGESFAVNSDVINDKNLLKKKIETLKAEVASLKAEIDVIEEDTIFKILNEIVDLDEYFEQKKVELTTQINSLESV
jgi:hypothetical protein